MSNDIKKILEYPIHAQNGFSVEIIDILNNYKEYDPEIAIDALFFVVKQLLIKLDNYKKNK